MKFYGTSDYLNQLSQALGTVKLVCFRENCGRRDDCWRDVDEVMKAAVLGEQNENAIAASEAYENYMSERLCEDGKDNLISCLLVTLYYMDNPLLVVPQFDEDDE